MLQKIEPSAPLREYVRHYVYRDGPAQILAWPVPPRPDLFLSFSLRTQYKIFDYRTGCVESLPDAIVVGPQTRRVVDLLMNAAHAGFYVYFQPAGFHRLFRQATGNLADLAYAASDVIGAQVTRLHERLRDACSVSEMVQLTEQFLAAHLPAARPFHPVHAAAEMLLTRHGQVSLSGLIEASGLSERQFERSFSEHIGSTPKLYARLARFDFAFKLKTAVPARTWTSVSHEAGYFDHSHLVKDFNVLTGMSPSCFLRLFPASMSASS